MRVPSIALIGLMLAAAPAAQTSSTQRLGSVRVHVHDATNLPIRGAEITLTSADGSSMTTSTSERGEGSFEDVRPGVYSARVESAGFSTFTIPRFSIRAGERIRREVTLQVAGFVEELEVTPAAEDQQVMNAFTRQLTDEEVAALPEDPEELALVLRQLFGDDADIRVDGFTGGRLPTGTQILEVRVRYDVGAASSGAGPRVEIRTTPGGDRWRNNATVSVRDEALSARDAFSGQRPLGQTRQYSWNLNGPLVRNRTGLSVSIDRSESIENQATRLAEPGVIYSRLIERPSNRSGISTRFEHQITAANAIRVDFTRTTSEARNQGIGDFDLPERAYTSEGSGGELRLGHHATLRGRYVNDFRSTLQWDSEQVSPLSDERAIRVLDAFTSGGAQQRGGHRSRTFEIGNDLEFTARRVHHITTGFSIDGADYHGDEADNTAGTYTFASLASFDAGQPTTFTQRQGDPTYSYSMYHFGWHVQDDYRVRRNLMVNLGLRHDFQTHVRDWVNLSPRLAVSWSPSSKARTTLRASMGVFYSQLTEGMYRQILLVNGRQQWDQVISNPGYPDPFSSGVAEALPTPSIIRASPDLEIPFNRRYSIGLDQGIGKFVRFRGTLTHQTGHHLFRSRDANAPVDGVRPDPSVLSVTELESAARSLSDSLQTELSITYPPKRLSANVSYVLGRALDETDGPFSLPPDSFDLSGEWGPARGDVRHRVNASVNSDLPGRFRLNASFRLQSGSPYNITSGTDTNGDGVHNERPAGVTRNAGRGTGTKNLDLTLTWRLGIGHRSPVDAPRGDSPVIQAPKRPPSSPVAARAEDIVRFEVFARATNVLNLVNPQNFSGVMTSPFFGLPTSLGTARRIVVGTRVWF
jgi:carboxypeptidase family protein